MRQPVRESNRVLRFHFIRVLGTVERSSSSCLQIMQADVVILFFLACAHRTSPPEIFPMPMLSTAIKWHASEKVIQNRDGSCRCKRCEHCFEFHRDQSDPALPQHFNHMHRAATLTVCHICIDTFRSERDLLQHEKEQHPPADVHAVRAVDCILDYATDDAHRTPWGALRSYTDHRAIPPKRRLRRNRPHV